MFASTPADVAFLLARILFGGTLAFMGLTHFLSVDEMAGYAEYKGLPAPTFSVLASGAVLVLGGLSLIAGVYPGIGAAALAGFLLVAAVTMHDFWRMDGEDAQNELTAFLKNVYGAGAALAFVAVADATWPYAVNVGL
ncbi:DoxX family protein [Halovivax gelatinilyticus]|uniref:DoxX family protein n=1 Tax=Halovivax gelatinilyticus TaxID=2961597 RepID=UPI0020CA8DBA|nr:DoxX family protein [Halovivax gelatinilyticus]